MKEYNINLDTINLGLRYFGFRWWHILLVKKKIKEKTYGKFDLIIDLQSKIRNSLILKRIPHHSFYSQTFNGILSSKKIKFESNDHIENLNLFLNEKIEKLEYDNRNLSKNIKNEAKKLLPLSNYVGFLLLKEMSTEKKVGLYINLFLWLIKSLQEVKCQFFLLKKMILI